MQRDILNLDEIVEGAKIVWKLAVDEEHRKQILANEHLRNWIRAANTDYEASGSNVRLNEIHINGVDRMGLDPSKPVVRVHVGIKYNTPEIDDRDRNYGVSLEAPSAVLLYVFKVANEEACRPGSNEPEHKYYAVAIDEIRPAFLGWTIGLPGGLADKEGESLLKVAQREFFEEAIPGFDLSKAFALTPYGHYTPGQQARVTIFADMHVFTPGEFQAIYDKWNGHIKKDGNEITRITILEYGDLYLAGKGPTTALPFNAAAWYADYCAIQGNKELREACHAANDDPVRREAAEEKYCYRFSPPALKAA